MIRKMRDFAPICVPAAFSFLLEVDEDTDWFSVEVCVRMILWLYALVILV
jgi:hypothetical protein